jgi:hypothetical protein
MAKKNVIGTCRLCEKRKRLCKSHYLGRALHKLALTNGQDAIMMTPKVIMATQRQLWAHLLCRECEERLNKFGEEQALRWIDNGRDFPLLNRMRLSCLVKEEQGTATFSGAAMGVNTEALAYFALALLWKGGVHQWPTAEGQKTSVPLGVFEEPMRKYLLGGPFPSNVYVLLGICEDRGSRGMIFAPTLMRETRHHTFSVLVRGLWFHVVADANAAMVKELCCVQSAKKVLHLENCAKRLIDAGRHIGKTARVATNVKG